MDVQVETVSIQHHKNFVTIFVCIEHCNKNINHTSKDNKMFRVWSSSWTQVTRSDLTKLGGNWQVGFETRTNVKENTRTKINTNLKENTRTKTKTNTRTGRGTWRASALV